MSSGYSLVDYGAMVEDPIRMHAYVEAMKRYVKPGSVVVELGSGPGIMALIACQLGAARVYAIEPDPSVEVARRLAVDNGFAERIVFLRKMSTEVDLPEQGDVLISDLRGRLPFLAHHVSSIRDARQRLLKPGGVQLPQSDRLMIGLARDEALYSKYTRPWNENKYGLDLRSGWLYAINSPTSMSSSTNTSLGQAQTWATLDYLSIESPNVSGEVVFDLPVGELINGLELWFEARVCEGIGYSTGPDQPDQVYGRAWLPLQETVLGAEGERMLVRIDKNLVDRDYVTRWSVRVLDREGKPRQAFKQSSFNSQILSAAELRQLDPSYAPASKPRTAAVRFILDQFDGTKSMASIAAAARSAHPIAFKRESEALDLVRELIRRYCPDA